MHVMSVLGPCFRPEAECHSHSAANVTRVEAEVKEQSMLNTSSRIDNLALQHVGKGEGRSGRT